MPNAAPVPTGSIDDHPDSTIKDTTATSNTAIAYETMKADL